MPALALLALLASPVPTDSRQLVLSVSENWSAPAARVRFYDRSPGAPWKPVGEATTASLGRAGLAWGRGLHPEDVVGTRKKEGDGKSPAGIFELRLATGYGKGAPPGSRLSYREATPTLRCVDDVKSRYYNKLVDEAAVVKDWSSAEDMRRPDELYRLVVWVGHNDSRPWSPEGEAASSCTFVAEPSRDHRRMHGVRRQNRGAPAGIPRPRGAARARAATAGNVPDARSGVGAPRTVKLPHIEGPTGALLRGCGRRRGRAPASGSRARSRAGRLPARAVNAITDVPGVHVGHGTLNVGERSARGSRRSCPTGGTCSATRCRARCSWATRSASSAGSTQVEELGTIETPIVLTNTLSVGTAIEAVVAWTLGAPATRSVRSVNALVGETNDGWGLNDIRGRHVAARTSSPPSRPRRPVRWTRGAWARARGPVVRMEGRDRHVVPRRCPCALGATRWACSCRRTSAGSSRWTASRWERARPARLPARDARVAREPAAPATGPA